jgi:hypothetical protein
MVVSAHCVWSYLDRANHSIVNYSAIAVNIYNASSSLVRFENKNILFTLKNALACYNAGDVVANSKVVGIDPGLC